MGWFIVTRAILVRTLFALHGVIAIWLLSVVTGDATSWYMATSLTGLMFEAAVTLFRKRGQEWKWYVPINSHHLVISMQFVRRAGTIFFNKGR